MVMKARHLLIRQAILIRIHIHIHIHIHTLSLIRIMVVLVLINNNNTVPLTISRAPASVAFSRTYYMQSSISLGCSSTCM